MVKYHPSYQIWQICICSRTTLPVEVYCVTTRILCVEMCNYQMYTRVCDLQ